MRIWLVVMFCVGCGGSKPPPPRDVNGYGPPGRCFQQPTELELEGPGGQFAQNWSNLPPCPPSWQGDDFRLFDAGAWPALVDAGVD